MGGRGEGGEGSLKDCSDGLVQIFKCHLLAGIESIV